MQIKYTLSADDLVAIYNASIKLPAAKWRVFFISLLMGVVFCCAYILMPANDLQAHMARIDRGIFFISGSFGMGFLFGYAVNFWNTCARRKQYQQYDPLAIELILSKQDVRIHSRAQQLLIPADNIYALNVTPDYLFINYKLKRKKGVIVIKRETIAQLENINELESLIHCWSAKFTAVNLT